jgi:hypothetical protein
MERHWGVSRPTGIFGSGNVLITVLERDLLQIRGISEIDFNHSS